MVAIIAGAGLGLERSSAWVLGSRGQVGQAQLGRGGDNVYVNAASGNLIVQNTDEMLIGLGQDDPVARTYNSLGALNDDNGDNWRESVSRQVTGLTGTVNTAGSTVTLIDWDGSDVSFAWDATRSAYVSKQGERAYDTLAYNTTNSTWTFTDGGTQIKETYDGANSGRITARLDPDGNSLTFSYTAGGLVSKVTTQNGEYTSFIYSGTNLTQVQTWRHPDAAGAQALAQMTRVNYGYDTSNRLTSVTVDLSPGDNVTTDGKVYTTTYGYDSTSKRLASITQTDGSSLTIAYVQVGAVYRVASLTQTSAAGQTRLTSFSYDTANLVTTVTDPMGFVTQLGYDAVGQLIKITAPPARSGAAVQVTQFAYNSGGDVTSVIAPDGATSTYAYDANGNRVSELDGAGVLITRTFSATNLMLTETSYPAGGAGTTTRYVYDVENHLRFVVSPLGEVTEYRYNAVGQQTAKLNYAGSTYDVSALSATQSPSEAVLQTWVGTLTGLTTSQRTDTTYDFRGNVASVTAYEKLTTAGVGDTAGVVSRTNYVYDQSGRMLSQLTPTAANAQTFVYDGLGRVIASTDFANATTSIAFNDAASQTVLTLANGQTQTSTYNLAGELISYSEAGSGVTTATTLYAYDADGRLRKVTDPTGTVSFRLYDNVGRKTADIAADGTIVEYAYNADNLLTTTIQYSQKLTTAQMTSLTDLNGVPLNVDVATIRPASTAADRWDWKIFDADQRLARTIDAAGYVTDYVYDGAGHLISTQAYANPVTASALVVLKTPVGTAVKAPPMASGPSVSTPMGAALTFDPRAAATDINGDVLTITAVGTPAHGTVTINSGGASVTYTPSASYKGLDSFSYTLSDGQGGSVSATASISVAAPNEFNNLAIGAMQEWSDGGTGIPFTPTLNTNYQSGGPALLLQKTLTATGAPVSGGLVQVGMDYLKGVAGNNLWDISGNEHFGVSLDVQGLSATNRVAVYVHYWDTNWNNIGDSPVTINAVGGTFTTLSQIVDAPANAAHAAIMVAQYGSGSATTQGTVYGVAIRNAQFVRLGAGQAMPVAVVNAAPVAVADVLNVIRNTAITFDPRINDTDLNADALTISAVGTAAHGTVAFTGASVTYTPTSGYTGADSFTYTISDGHGGTKQASVSVTVRSANYAPTSSGITVSAVVGTALTFDPRVSAADSDGDGLSISAVGTAAHGAVTFTGTSVTYTPTAGYKGADSFTYTLSDGRGGTVTATATVGVYAANLFTNLAPGAVQTWSDGGTGAFTASTSATAPVVIQKSLASAGSTTPDGLVWVGSTAVYGAAGNNAWDLTASQPFGVAMDLQGLGAMTTVSVSIHYWKSDWSPLSDSALVLQNVNSGWTSFSQIFTAPALAAHATLIIGQAGIQTASQSIYGLAIRNAQLIPLASGQAMHPPLDVAPVAVNDAVGVATNGQLNFDPRLNDSDPDGDALTITAAGTPSHGTVALGSGGASIIYTPTNGYSGADSFTYTVTDGRGGSSVATINVTVGSGVVTTWDTANKAANVVLSNGGLTATLSGASQADGNVRATTSKSTGKWRFEMAIGHASLGGYPDIGIATAAASLTSDLGADYSAIEYQPNGRVYLNNTLLTTLPTFSTGDVIAVEVDFDNKLIYFQKQGGARSAGISFAGMAGPLFPVFGGSAVADAVTANFGAASFVVTPTAGFAAWDSGHSPNALADSVTTGIGQAVTFDPRLNDSDPDGDALTITAVGAAAHGTVTITGGGTSVTYTPASGYVGADSFTYTISDGHGGATTSTALMSVGSIVAASAADRVSRNFYDLDGRLVGGLDALGYLTQTLYDAAGRKTQTIQYANATAPNLRASGSFASLLTSVGTNVADIHNWYLYDGQGLLRAQIDGEGDLTRFAYDASGFVTQTITGQKLDPTTLLATPPTLANLPAAPAGQVLETTGYTRDAFGKALTTTRTLASGSETTTFQYDNMQRLVSSTTASGTPDARTSRQLFDVRGRLIKSLGGVGSAALAALGATPTQAQIDQVYATYGTSYVYDGDDRLIQKIEPNGTNATGVRTLYYYDALGRLTYEINAAGEVTQYAYDTFGERTDATQRAVRIAASTLSGLTGGTVTAGLTSAIIGNGQDRRSQIAYDLRGAIIAATDAMNVTTRFTYDAFGEAISRTEPAGASGTTKTSFAYDARGELISQTQDVGGLNLTTTHAYDAFGREIQSVDPTGRVRTTGYDRAGRTISTVDAAGIIGLTETYTYDGRGAVLTHVDATGATTSYAYTPFNRQVTVTTPEGVTTTSTYNPYGQTVAITDGAGRTTSWSYDKDGHVTSVTDSSGAVTAESYDFAGRLASLTDPRGVVTSFSYDAVDRLLTRVVDPGTPPTSLNLTTSYQYDAFGGQVQVTDPTGTVTAISYDADGRKTSVITDRGSAASNLNLTTTYAYDQRGQVLTLTEAAASSAQKVTQYSYDAAGRLTQTIVDPLGLQITTSYAYDAAGHVVAKTDALNNVTRYVYDGAGRLVFSIDPLGDVVRTDYDGEGRVTGRYAFATALSNPGSLASSLSVSDVATRVTASSADQYTGYVYDGDGRMAFSVDAAGRATRYQYDGSNNVVQTTVYNGLIATQATPYSRTAVTSATQAIAGVNDRVSSDIYDVANRRVYSRDAAGGVTGYTYDANGNVTVTSSFTDPYTGAVTKAALDAWASGEGTLRQTRALYDAANRLAFSVDGSNQSIEYQYDTAGRLTAKIVYPNAVTVPANATAASLKALLGTPTGRAITSYTYDSAGRLTDIRTPITDTVWALTHRTLDAMGQVTREQFAGQTTDYVRDALGRVIQKTEANGLPSAILPTGSTLAVVTAYSYDKLDHLRTVTDGRNLVTENVYDAAGRLIQVKTPSTLDTPAIEVTYYDYNALGQLYHVIGTATGGHTWYYFDKLNRQTLQLDALNYATATTYSVGGEVASVTRYYQPVTDPTRNTPPALVFTSGKDELTSFGRDKLDRLTSTTDAQGYTETYQLDTLGRRVMVTSKLGAVTRNTYDASDNLRKRETSLSLYDAVGSVTTTTYAYDARGNRTQMVEAAAVVSEARTTTYGYDLGNRLTSVTGDPLRVWNQDTLVETTGVIPIQTYDYDLRGNQIRSTDANGASTYTYYDTLNHKIAQIDPVGTYSYWTYDLDGNVASAGVYGVAATLPPPLGGTPPSPVSPTIFRETTYTYDRTNRQTSSTVANVLVAHSSPGVAGMITETVDLVTTTTYDRAGNVVQQTDPRNNKSLFSFYDLLGRKIAQVDQLNYLTSYTLDAEGNVLQEARYATAVSGTVSTASDPAALQQSVAKTADDRITSFTYDRMGRRLTETRLGVQAWSVNATSGALQALGGQNSTITYTYNALGEVTSKQQATSEATTYTYDNAGRLLVELLPIFVNYEGKNEQRQTSYTYDKLGNVTLMRVGNTVETSATAEYTHYIYGAGGRLKSIGDAEGNTLNYDYDAAGHRISESYGRVTNLGRTMNEARTYKYDAAGRVIQQGFASFWSSWEFVDQDNHPTDTTNTRYDAYGEVTGRGKNGAFQETYEYDNAGRVWRSTQGDGYAKVYMYNAAGDLTVQLESDGSGDLSIYGNLGAVVSVLTGAGAHAAGTAAVAGMAMTVFANDARHQQIAVSQLFRQLSYSAASGYSVGEIDTQTTYNAFGEVSSEISANNLVAMNAALAVNPSADTSIYKTEYSYNTMGRLIQTLRPQIDYTDATGAVNNPNNQTIARRSPDLSYYDVAGRLIGQLTPRHGLTTWTLQAGRGYQGDQEVKLEEWHPDGGTVTYGVNVFGLTRTITYNAAQPVEHLTYDKLNRLVRVDYGAAMPASVDDTTDLTAVRYAYDSQGQRIRTWTNALGTSDTDTAMTDYDTEGRVIRTKALGVSTAYTDAYTTYSYSWVPAGSWSVSGGWLVTTNAANGTISTDKKDYFGKTIQHTDGDALDSLHRVVQYNYTYDMAGHLTEDARVDVNGANWAAFSYQFFNTGNNKQIIDRQNLAVTVTTTYGYDADGNVLKEYSTGAGGSNTFVLEDSAATYDRQDRIVHLVESSPGAVWNGGDSRPNALTTIAASGSKDTVSASAVANNTITLDYYYTTSGDLRHLTQSYTNPAKVGGTLTKDDWYAYDSMDRVTLTRGVYVGTPGTGHIERQGGVDITYDTMGRRATTTALVGGLTHTENYSYDWAGNLTSVVSTDNGWATSYTQGSDARDALGRLTSHMEYDASGRIIQQRALTYDHASNVLTDVSWTRQADNTLAYSSATNTYTDLTNSAVYRGGVITQTTANTGTTGAGANPGAPPTTTQKITTNTYDWANGGREVTIQNSGANTYHTDFSYNRDGSIYTANVYDGDTRALWYATNAQGEVVSRFDMPITGNYEGYQNFYVFDGKQVADIGDTGASANDYAQASQQRYIAPTGGLGKQPYANFDQFYDATSPTSGSAEATGYGAIYTTKAGDTLQSIALAVWGDASLWYLLANANGLSGQESLVAGLQVRVPSGVTNAHNNVRNATVYDVGEALGNVGPFTPAAPKHHKACGGLGAILVAAVAIAVTIVTAGAAVAALAPLGATGGTLLGGLGALAAGTTGLSAATLVGIGAAAAAAGSIVSQGVGVLTGVQDKFSWKQVAFDAIIGGATAGLTSIDAVSDLMKSGNIFAQAAVAGGDNVLRQGVGMLTGLQSKFDWKSLAVASIMGGTDAPISNAVGALNLGSGLTGMASMIAHSAERSLLTGTDFGDNILSTLKSTVASTIGNAVAGRVIAAVDSFGSTIGNMVAGQMAARPSPQTASNGASDGWVDGGVNLQGAAARYAADHPVSIGDWSNGSSAVDALSGATMGNGEGGSFYSSSGGAGQSSALALLSGGGMLAGGRSPLDGRQLSWQSTDAAYTVGDTTYLPEVVVAGRPSTSYAGSSVTQGGQSGLLDRALNAVGLPLLNFVGGAAMGFVNTVNGAFNAVTHPAQTLTAIGNGLKAAYNYAERTSVAQALSDAGGLVTGYGHNVAEAYRTGGFNAASSKLAYDAGGLTFNVGSSFVGLGELKAATSAVDSLTVLTGRAAGISLDGPVPLGTTVYRVFGENNNPLGLSWTRVDPSSVVNYRSAAGLPDVNTGRFVIEGELIGQSGVTTRSALPLDGNPGGLDEVLIPNADTQVRLRNVSGVNPRY